jgi:hypothetical protein
MRVGVIAAGLCLLALQGCSTYAVQRYSASAESVEKLRSMAPATARVGVFTMAGELRKEITCRAVGPIATIDGETFPEYTRKALSSEMRMAGVYSEAAPTTISGKLDQLDFSSTGGYWDIAMTISSSNGEKVSKSIRHAYPSNFIGEIACNQTAQAFMPAVQDLIGATISDPSFSRMLAPAVK